MDETPVVTQYVSARGYEHPVAVVSAVGGRVEHACWEFGLTGSSEVKRDPDGSKSLLACY